MAGGCAAASIAGRRVAGRSTVLPMPPRTVRSRALAALAVAVVLPLGGCGDDDPPSRRAGACSTDADGDVTINGSYDPLREESPSDMGPQEIASAMAEACKDG